MKDIINHIQTENITCQQVGGYCQVIKGDFNRGLEIIWNYLLVVLLPFKAGVKNCPLFFDQTDVKVKPLVTEPLKF